VSSASPAPRTTWKGVDDDRGIGKLRADRLAVGLIEIDADHLHVFSVGLAPGAQVTLQNAPRAAVEYLMHTFVLEVGDDSR